MRENTMKTLIIALTCLAIASTAFAQVDPDPDMIGVYFDLGATNNCLQISPHMPFFAYVIITNPTGVQVGGVEFGYNLVNTSGPGTLFRLATILPAGAVDLGNSTNLMVGN